MPVSPANGAASALSPADAPRPRRMLYLAALAARRYDKAFHQFADRLVAAGKPPKLAIVAVMRKLIEAANLILKRNQPWIKRPA